MFDCVHSLYYNCHRINCKRDGSYIDSPDWIKNKKAIINLQNGVIAVLNHEEIKKVPQRIINIKPFINKYNWKGIYYPSEKNDWK